MNMNPYAPPTAVVADMPSEEENPPPFFPVSTRKLLILSVCTLGFYQVYWFYKNWQLIRIRERTRISPAPRAIFAIFFCYQCFARIRDFDGSKPVKGKLAAGPLAIGWIVTSLLQVLPEPYWLISLLSIGFMVPVQKYANQINAAHCSDHDTNSDFSFLNWLAVGIGSLLLVLAVIEANLPTGAP